MILMYSLLSAIYSTVFFIPSRSSLASLSGHFTSESLLSFKCLFALILCLENNEENILSFSHTSSTLNITMHTSLALVAAAQAFRRSAWRTHTPGGYAPLKSAGAGAGWTMP
jgi:hypothetical protein